ncbi:MAG TPA: maleylpyruvate isomerase N-terminal domain-containing protein, partial [Acidimicrobiales bacterium]
MKFPGEQDLLDERAAVVATLASLSDEEFEHGTTLCEGWAPRDVTAHLIGVDRSLGEYARALGNVRNANAAVVEHARGRDRAALMAAARQWAEASSLTTR